MSLNADITLSEQDEQNWNIKTSKAKELSFIPLGEYIMRVTTPPDLLYTVSVPYEAQVAKLNKVSYEKVKKGEVLATLTSSKWIDAQKEAIADHIETMRLENEALRKEKLCKEEIIAQKECIFIESELKRSKIKFFASKALLKAYGADDKSIKTIFKDLRILPNIELLSPIDGTLLTVNVEPGKGIISSAPLFVIRSDGENWLESDLPLESAKKLLLIKEIAANINEKEIALKILNIAPTLNPNNQTRHVRFALPKNTTLLAGLRTKVKLNIKTKAFSIDKKAVVQEGKKSIIFIKKGSSYKALEADVLYENKDRSFIKYDDSLKEPIVVNGTGILQNMMQRDEK